METTLTINQNTFNLYNNGLQHEVIFNNRTYGFTETLEEAVQFVNNLELIKFRKAKMTSRGVYIQDKELLDTDFEIGGYFLVEFFPENKTVVLSPNLWKTEHTVSKRKAKDVLKPVLDVRGKQVLACFEGCSELEVYIHKDHIEVIGIQA